MLTNYRQNSVSGFLAGLRVGLAAVIFLLQIPLALFAEDLQDLTRKAEIAKSAFDMRQKTAAQTIKPIEDVFQFKEKPKLRGYTYNLKDLIAMAERNIKKVDQEIVAEEVRKRNEAREAEILSYFMKGNQLYKQGRLKEAKQEWENAVRISRDPEMKQYIEDSDRQAKLQARKEEKNRKARLEAEEKELRSLANRMQVWQVARLAALEWELNRLANESSRQQ